MAFFGRKMLEKLPFHIGKSVKCLGCPKLGCHDDCGDGIYVPSDGPYYPPPPPPIVNTSEKHHVPFYFIMMLCVLGAFFVLICYMIIRKRNRSNSRSTRGDVSQFGENREDFGMDENLGPILDHPIWYIRTVGLGQDVIDSISVFKYKKDELLIEGTDCSVCLTEFEEDESLRLLPKCSHAFHIPCIDTWLRSHKNCPLCRAPIVSAMDSSPRMENVVEVVSSTSARGDDGSSPSEVVEGRENLELDEEGGNQETRRGVLENLDDEEGRSTMDPSMKSTPLVLDGRRNGDCVYSDLVDQHRVEVMKNELQPGRRSVSMDSSAAQVIHLEMNEMMNTRKMDQGCSSSKRGDRNSNLYKAMKSSSFGRSLQKVPISMKRSISTSGKQDLRQTM